MCERHAIESHQYTGGATVHMSIRAQAEEQFTVVHRRSKKYIVVAVQAEEQFTAVHRRSNST